jgi:hypothetical protein
VCVCVYEREKEREREQEILLHWSLYNSFMTDSVEELTWICLGEMDMLSCLEKIKHWACKFKEQTLGYRKLSKQYRRIWGKNLRLFVRTFLGDIWTLSYTLKYVVSFQLFKLLKGKFIILPNSLHYNFILNIIADIPHFA